LDVFLLVLIDSISRSFWPAAAGGRTQSGTFRDGDLLVNKDGLRIVSHSEEGEVN
jgi:hypothetical protein